MPNPIGRSDIQLIDRLVINADLLPPTREDYTQIWVRDQVLFLAHKLRETKAWFKMSSSLRQCGYGIIPQLHGGPGLRVFADLCLNGSLDTLKQDAQLLDHVGVDAVSVDSAIGRDGLDVVRAALPDARLVCRALPMGYLDTDARSVYQTEAHTTSLRLLTRMKNCGMSEVVLSPSFLEAGRPGTEFWRSLAIMVETDIQNIATNFKFGADRFIVNGFHNHTDPKKLYDGLLVAIDRATKPQ